MYLYLHTLTECSNTKILLRFEISLYLFATMTEQVLDVHWPKVLPVLQAVGYNHYTIVILKKKKERKGMQHYTCGQLVEVMAYFQDNTSRVMITAQVPLKPMDSFGMW